MDITKSEESAEWRSRLAHALRACLQAADRFATRAETTTLDQRVRVLEEEGRSRGFMLTDKSRH